MWPNQGLLTCCRLLQLPAQRCQALFVLLAHSLALAVRLSTLVGQAALQGAARLHF